jgi:hypothetical protein
MGARNASAKLLLVMSPVREDPTVRLGSLVPFNVLNLTKRLTTAVDVRSKPHDRVLVNT